MTSERRRAAFATTRWSTVVASGQPDGPRTRAALAELCAVYWTPLYVFARRRGADSHRAEDLVQGFFAELLEKNWTASADRERGRFRTFLLTAFRRHCADEHERARAQKRGGDTRIVTLDTDRVEPELGSETDPARAFDRKWALTILDRAFERTRAAAAKQGREALFARLAPFIGGSEETRPYAEIADELGMTVGAVKVAVHRLRARYRVHLREEIRDTVATDADIDSEVRELLDALRAR